MFCYTLSIGNFLKLTQKMEFSFYIRKDFSVDSDGFLILEGNKLTSSFLPSNVLYSNKKYSDGPSNLDQTKKLAEILNRMGEASAKVMNK